MDSAKEEGGGLDNGNGNSSFGQILSMVSPESAMSVTEAVIKRGYSEVLLRSFADHVQRDESVEFTYGNLKRLTEAKLSTSGVRGAMVVLQPIKMEITGRDFSTDDCNITVPDFPFDPTRGSHTVRIESTVYIDKSDFRTEDSEDYFGLAPGKIVGLKYAFPVLYESFETDAAGEVVLLRCKALPDSELPEDKPKGSIQWVPASTAVPLEVRLYNPLFKVEDPTDWAAEINAESEVIMAHAVADPSISTWNPSPDEHFQFERLGIFVVESDFGSNKLTYVQTVGFAAHPYFTKNDDMSLKQRTAKARQSVEQDKRRKLTVYLTPSGGTNSPHGSAKVNMAERAELARLAAEQETHAKIERLKEANAVSSGYSFSRAESARLEEEQQAQLKLERLKKEKMADFVRKGSGSLGGEDGADNTYLSPIQRKEEMKRRAEQEKQERLAGFLQTTPSESSGDGGDDVGSAVSIKERFERAKQLQHQSEEERLDKLRNSTSKQVRRASTVAIKDVWSEVLNESKSNKESGGQERPTSASVGAGGIERAKSKWAEALSESKQSEEQRVNRTKRQTIAQFRLTDGTGLVKKRIGEWEELFMELAASVEDLEQTLAAARLLSEKNDPTNNDIAELHRLQKAFRESAEVPEEFELGTTKIYNIKLMDHHIASYIKRSLQDVKTKHLTLSCGVYGDQEGGKPPIDLYAAAIKSDDRTMYIALTIKATPGFELDPRVYGVKKVAIFSKDVNQKMLERVVDIIPEKGWEGWVAKGSYDDTQSATSFRGEGVAPTAGVGASVNADASADAAGVDNGGESSNIDTHGDAPLPAVVETEHSPAADSAPEPVEETSLLEQRLSAQETADVEPRLSSESVNLGFEGDTVVEEELPVDPPLEDVPSDHEGEIEGEGEGCATNKSVSFANTTTDFAGDAWKDVDGEESEADGELGNAALVDIMGEDVGNGEDAGAQAFHDVPDESVDEPMERESMAAGTAQRSAPGEIPADVDVDAATEGLAEIEVMEESEGRGTNQFLADYDSADDDESSDEDGVEDDVGEDTWKTTNTPNKTPNNTDSSAAEVIVRDASADYKFDTSAAQQDATLRFIKGEEVTESSAVAPDADGDEEVEYDAEEDAKAETFNAFKPSTVARVCVPRAFLPEHVSSEMLKNPNSKYSWSHEDEREEGLLSANQTSVSINLQDITNHHCSRNMLVLEGSEQCMVFTGTLKCGTSASKYILNGNKIFEWVRGAACSGWLLKWPMQSQKFGRRMLRFFVLRDHILSYHVTRPADEEEVYSNYSLSSLHITENTTVEVGRHMFLRSLVITTPLDKLWIRMQNGNAEETKWISNINKSIQQLQRKKLFMSKVRIESKWYHESDNFFLVAVDALSLGDQYIKVALFELFTANTAPGSTAQATDELVAPPSRQYSVDIGTNIADGSSLGIEGAPSTHSAKLVRTNESADLRSELKCLKIYGDVILLGGSNGFLGVGAMGFTSSVDANGDPMQVMFCVPCGTTQQADPSLGSPMRNPSGDASGRGSEVPDSPMRNMHRAGSFMVGPGYPHRRSATVLSIAAAQGAHRFVAADSEGTISLWYFYKHNAISENLENLRTPKKSSRNPRPPPEDGTPGRKSKRRGSEKLMVRKPQLKGVLSLSSIDLSGLYGDERVVEMNFLLDESQLIVSTNKRLILLLLGKRGDKASSPMAARAMPVMSSPLSPINMTPTSPAPSNNAEDSDLSFIGWVELDRAIPGKVGLFAMHMSQNYVPLYPGSSTASLQRTITQWRVTEEDAAVSSRFQLTSKKKPVDGKNRCTVYRFEWTEGMFSAALDQVKYL